MTGKWKTIRAVVEAKSNELTERQFVWLIHDIIRESNLRISIEEFKRRPRMQVKSYSRTKGRGSLCV